MGNNLIRVFELAGGKQYSTYASICCPFHHETSPSMLVNEKWYNCLSCGEHGHTENLIQYLETGNIVIHKKSLPSPHLWGWAEEFDPTEFALKAHNHLKRNPDLGYYLKERKISQLIDTCMLGFWDGFYTFPAMDQNKDIVGIVARAGPIAQEQYHLRYMQPKGQKVPLYSPDWAKVYSEPYTFVTYGIIDALSIATLGFPAISSMNGHTLKSEYFQSLRKMIYIIVDKDGRDTKNALQVAGQLLWRGKIVTLPDIDGVKDCNDILKIDKYTLQQVLLSVRKQNDPDKYKIVSYCNEEILEPIGI